jgi:hypothetical protein
VRVRAQASRQSPLGRNFDGRTPCASNRAQVRLESSGRRLVIVMMLQPSHLRNMYMAYWRVPGKASRPLPVGDHVGESGRRHDDHGERDQHLAKKACIVCSVVVGARCLRPYPVEARRGLKCAGRGDLGSPATHCILSVLVTFFATSQVILWLASRSLSGSAGGPAASTLSSRPKANRCRQPTVMPRPIRRGRDPKRVGR